MKKDKPIIDMEKIDREPIYKMAALMIGITFLLLIFSVVRKGLFGDIPADKHIILEIVFLVLLAVLAEVAVFYLKQQSAITLMLLGIMLSPSFLKLAWSVLPITHTGNPPVVFEHEEIIHVFAQLGAIILLFKVGMHSKIEKIFSKVNLLVASLGIIFPFFMGFLYARATSGSFAYSMFIGAALAATSVGVTVAVLKSLKVLGNRFSQIIIGAAIIDDVLALLLLSFVLNTTGVSEQNTSLIRMFLTAAVFIAGSILTGRYVIRYLDRKEMGSKRFLLSIAYMLVLAYVAEVIQLSAIVGAFLAGIMLNKSRHYDVIQERTIGLELLFMPIFFISLGLLVDVTSIILYIGPIMAVTAIAFASKIIGCGLASLSSKLSMKDSLLVGIGMVPRGEVALIIASIGLTDKVLTQGEYSVISAMALLTAFIAPMILAWLIKKNAAEKSA